MLFYAKKNVWLDLAVTLILLGIGWAGIQRLHVPCHFAVNATALAQGFAGFLIISGWTFLVQKGYAVVKGQLYADNLTISLAKEYADASLIQAVAGGITAALGEEVFFRGFIQGTWGIVAGTLLFGLAHFGKKDIRIVSYWSFAHGLIFGLLYYYTANLLVPMMAHGLFDLGGVIYFQRITRSRAT